MKRDPLDRMIGAPCDDDRGAVPNVGVSPDALSPMAKDRLIGWQLERALGRDGIGAAAKEAAQVGDKK